MHLGDDCVTKAIRMGFIVVGVKTIGKFNRSHIMNALSCAQIESQFALGEQGFVEHVKGLISRKRMHYGCERRRDCNIST
jgi:hypothetical protein